MDWFVATQWKKGYKRMDWFVAAQWKKGYKTEKQDTILTISPIELVDRTVWCDKFGSKITSQASAPSIMHHKQFAQKFDESAQRESNAYIKQLENARKSSMICKGALLRIALQWYGDFCKNLSPILYKDICFVNDVITFISTSQLLKLESLKSR